MRKPKSTSILNYFPGTPRDVQATALQEVADSWASSDVFVLSMPTASGKSKTSVTLARWAHGAHKMKSSILVPTRILVDQFLAENPRFHTVKAQDEYVCATYEHQEHKESCKRAKQLNDDKKFCPGCPYMQAVRKSHVMPYGVYNYYAALAHKLYRDVLIIDEAHLVLGLLQDMAGKKLWHKDYGFPERVRTYGTLLDWVKRHPRLKTDSKLQMLHSELNSGKARYLVQRGVDLLRGEEEECLKLLPVDVRDAPPILWPTGKVKKIILLSGTIGRKDVEALGLDRRRVRFVSVPSPIPVENRPVYYEPQGNMSAANQERNLPRLVEYLKRKMAERPEPGLIHAPYSLAQKLGEALAGDPRILTHTQDNKSEVYRRFMAEGKAGGLVMIASGLYEGADITGDLGRWQVITKVPYASLGEPAYKWLAETDPEGYAWLAARLVVQATGRICRGPTDWGHTYITDESFERLFNSHEDIFPIYFKEAIVDHST